MDDREIIDALSALAHGTRLRAYRLLVEAGDGGLPAGTVATAVDVAPTALSGHLGILSRAGLVTAERRGRTRIYRGRPDRVRALASALLDGRMPGRS